MSTDEWEKAVFDHDAQHFEATRNIKPSSLVTGVDAFATRIVVRMNHCAGNGYLVNGTAVLPTDPTDFYVPGLPIVGCSNLRCVACNSRVRNAVGLAFRRQDNQGDVAKVYETRDLATAPDLGECEAEFRLYLCKCSRWLENTRHGVSPEDRDMQTDPPTSWVCADHPVLELPCEVDGIWIANRSELADVTARVLHGWNPPGARESDHARAAWAARLHQRLSSEDARAMGAPLATALTDPDPLVRARTLAFLVRVPVADAIVRAGELLQGDRVLFIGIPDGASQFKGDATLERALWRAIGPLLAQPGPVRDLARAEALASAKGTRALYDILSANDSAWMAEHAVSVARATPAMAQHVVYSFQEMPDRALAQHAEDAVSRM